MFRRCDSDCAATYCHAFRRCCRNAVSRHSVSLCPPDLAPASSVATYSPACGSWPSSSCPLSLGPGSLSSRCGATAARFAFATWLLPCPHQKDERLQMYGGYGGGEEVLRTSHHLRPKLLHHPSRALKWQGPSHNCLPHPEWGLVYTTLVFVPSPSN
jgi:hypothetical protein